MTDVTEQLSLVEREHAQGIHAQLGAKPYSCRDCWPQGSPGPAYPAAPPAAPSTPVVTGRAAVDGVPHVSRALREARRRTFADVPGLPVQPEPDPSVMPDGGPPCDTCHGWRKVHRLVAVGHPDFGRAIDCPDCAVGPLAQQRLDRLLDDLPPKYRGFRLSSFPTFHQAQREWLAVAREWLDNDALLGLYLWGPVGRGKSGLATGLTIEAIERGHTAKLVIVDRLLDKLRSTYQRGEDSYQTSDVDILAALRDVYLLCIDDLGAERHKRDYNAGPLQIDWATEQLHKVIGGRHIENKRTIFTSNLSLQDLTTVLGHERTVSRIEEMTRGTPPWILNFASLPYLRSDDPGVVQEAAF